MRNALSARRSNLPTLKAGFALSLHANGNNASKDWFNPSVGRTACLHPDAKAFRATDADFTVPASSPAQ